MLQGLLHHDTDVEIEANITDTHGASIVGFGFCELLGFKLMPRLKQIGRIPLYPPGLPTDGAWEAIRPVISARPINWDLIAQQYDELVKYATALKLGTAEAQQLLRRFTRGGPKHPAHQAMEELLGPGRKISGCGFPCANRRRRLQERVSPGVTPSDSKPFSSAKVPRRIFAGRGPPLWRRRSRRHGSRRLFTAMMKRSASG